MYFFTVRLTGVALANTNYVGSRRTVLQRILCVLPYLFATHVSPLPITVRLARTGFLFSRSWWYKGQVHKYLSVFLYTRTRCCKYGDKTDGQHFLPP